MWYILALYFLFSVPTISTLISLNWTDDDNGDHCLGIRDTISHRWEEVGDLLGLTSGRLEGIKLERLGDVTMCCRDVLVDWLSRNQSDYPTTWEGVLRLLKNMKLSTTAQDLQNALKV